MRKKVLYTFGTLCLASILVSGYVVYSIEEATRNLRKLLELHRVADLRDEMLHEIEVVQDDLHLKETRYARDLAELVSHVSKMTDTISCHSGFSPRTSLFTSMRVCSTLNPVIGASPIEAIGDAPFSVSLNSKTRSFSRCFIS